MPLGVPVSPAPPGSLLSATAVTDTVGGGIVAVSATSPAVLTFAADHGLQTGSTIIVAGTATTPTTVGTFVVTVPAGSTNTVTIPVAVTAVVTGTGTATVKALQQQVGVPGVAQDGTDASGVTPPTGAVGIRGWLSGIYSKLSAALAVTQSGTWTVATTGADGSQATIGNTGDANSATTLVGLLKAIKAAITGTVTVSGSVTANAGTNLNTSALATETGGNLATIAGNTGKIPALGQAAMAASAPVTIANNQSAVPISAASLPLPTGAATTAKQATLNAAGAATTAPAAARPSGIAHRAGITAADKLALPGTLTLSAITEAGSTLPASALFGAVSAGNQYGVTGPGVIPASITPVANQAVRMAWAQVAGATYYDLFLSTAAAPLWVARVTEAQRASGGFIVSVVGVVSAGSSAAGSIDIGIQGTGQATSAAAFSYNTAYLPGNATLVNCAGYSRAHVLVDVTLTDLRSAPALTIVPMLVGQVGGNWHAGKPQVVALLGAAGQALYSDWEIDIDGSSGLVVLVDSIAGQGTSAVINLELA